MVNSWIGPGRRMPIALAQESGVGEHQLGGKQSLADQIALGVQVGEDQVEQLGPLDHTGFDP